jgi:hypothetical protein
MGGPFDTKDLDPEEEGEALEVTLVWLPLDWLHLHAQNPRLRSYINHR